MPPEMQPPTKCSLATCSDINSFVFSFVVKAKCPPINNFCFYSSDKLCFDKVYEDNIFYVEEEAEKGSKVLSKRACQLSFPALRKSCACV